MSVVINSIAEMKTLIKSNFHKFPFKALKQTGDYHFQKLLPGFLFELRVELDSDGDHSLVFQYHLDNQMQPVKITTIKSFKKYKYQDIMYLLIIDFGKLMFDKLGESGKFVFDGVDYYKTFVENTELSICKEVKLARENFYRGYNLVKAPFRIFTKEPVTM